MNERKNDDGGGDIDNFSICLIDDLWKKDFENDYEGDENWLMLFYK